MKQEIRDLFPNDVVSAELPIRSVIVGFCRIFLAGLFLPR
jgi:hypothetical protein